MASPYFNDGSVVKYSFAGNDLQISWDVTNQVVTLVAVVPENNYFSVGFGRDMYNTDMILWQNKASSAVTTDLWSKDRGTPKADATQNYRSRSLRDSSGAVTFTSMRLMDTGDSLDFAIPTDTDLLWCWAQKNSFEFVEHDQDGKFRICFGSDGSVGVTGCNAKSLQSGTTSSSSQSLA